MLKSLLVGLEDSLHSDRAVGLGIDWAKRFDSQVAGLGVVDEPTICAPEPVPLGSSGFKIHRDKVLLSDARRRIQAALGRFAERCKGQEVPHQVHETVGLPFEQILLESQCHDLVIIGRKANFHFETSSGGDDTLRKVLKESPRPVVVVPGSEATGTGVLIAYNSSMPVARTLHSFGLLGLDRLGPVHVLAVEDKQSDAEEHVNRAATYLRNRQVEVTTHPVVSKTSVGEVILDKAREVKAGLLVMGCYGHSALRDFFVGSVTRTILNESPIPMMMWH